MLKAAIDSPATRRERGIPLPELLRTMEGTWVGDPPSLVKTIRIDSREIQPGDCFVALEGTDAHGHEYVDHAFERGASAAIVEAPIEAEGPVYRAPDSLRALQECSRRHRIRHRNMFVIGVTGSCGKTTVKEMVAALLRPRYSVGKTPGNYNNHIGLPLTILNQGRGDVLVAECGVNYPGEMEQLCRWLRPDWGVITHIGPSHLEGFGTVEAVAREKAKLLEALPVDGMAFFPTSVAHRVILMEAAACPVVLSKESGSRITVGEQPTGDTQLNIDGETVKLSVNSPGWVIDAVLSADIALRLGVQPDTVRSVLGAFEPLSGRGRTFEVNGCRIIDGSYNANPSSMDDSLTRLAEAPGPRLAVLGEMKEMGSRSPEAHRELGERAAKIPDLEFHYVGSFQEEVREGYESGGIPGSYHREVEELEHLDPGEFKSALVKGSHSVGLDRLIQSWTDRS